MAKKKTTKKIKDELKEELLELSCKETLTDDDKVRLKELNDIHELTREASPLEARPQNTEEIVEILKPLMEKNDIYFPGNVGRAISTLTDSSDCLPLYARWFATGYIHSAIKRTKMLERLEHIFETLKEAGHTEANHLTFNDLDDKLTVYERNLQKPHYKDKDKMVDYNVKAIYWEMQTPRMLYVIITDEFGSKSVHVRNVWDHPNDFVNNYDMGNLLKEVKKIKSKKELVNFLSAHPMQDDMLSDTNYEYSRKPCIEDYIEGDFAPKKCDGLRYGDGRDPGCFLDFKESIFEDDDEAIEVKDVYSMEEALRAIDYIGFMTAALDEIGED